MPTEDHDPSNWTTPAPVRLRRCWHVGAVACIVLWLLTALLGGMCIQGTVTGTTLLAVEILTASTTVATAVVWAIRQVCVAVMGRHDILRADLDKALALLRAGQLTVAEALGDVSRRVPGQRPATKPTLEDELDTIAWKAHLADRWDRNRNAEEADR